MSSRGRPPTQDILTPREYEVLELLRQGFTNREIAGRLGISLAGAKYHVSEIITKLGVASREEAATWGQEGTATRSRRWAGVPFLGGLRFPPALASLPTSQYVLAAAVPLVALTLAAGIWASGVAGGEEQSAGLVASSPTPDPFCPVPQCIRIDPERLTTLQEVVHRASFVPLTVQSLPAGFEQREIIYWRFPAVGSEAPDPKAVHNDWLAVTYRNGAGETLVISQGFPAMPGLGLCNSRERDPARWPRPGSVTVQGREACWLASAPMTIVPGSPPLSGLMLAFQVGRFGTGWAISPEGSYFSGSPMSISFSSDGLSLDELIAVAESMKLPAMATPLNGATPERGW